MMLKKTLKSYPFSSFILCVILFLSLMPIPETELSNVPFVDKWTHIAMYGGFSLVLWFESLRQVHHNCKSMTTWSISAFMPVVLSGILELLQEYATNCRSGEWWDMLANTLGVVLASIVACTILRRLLDK